MKSWIIISVFFFLNIMEIYSQSDFRKGYIIKNNNDTICGLINYGGNKSNSKKCIFKKDIQSKKEEFTPNDLKAYRYAESKYYVSKLVKMSNGIEELLFLEYLIKGTVDIYCYTDNFEEHYLISDSNKLCELKTEKKEIIIDNNSYIKDSKEYIGILKYIFRKSTSVSKKAENADLSHKSLIKLAEDYHHEVCPSEECIIYQKKISPLMFQWGPLVGLNLISISITDEFSDNFYYLRNSQFDKRIYPSIGFFCKVNMPFLSEHFYFQYEGTFSHVKFETSNYYNKSIDNLIYINDISLAQNAFNNSIFIKYEFLKGKIRPTFELGGFLSNYFKTEYKRNLEVDFSWGDSYIKQEMNENPFDKYDYGINFGLGMISKFYNEKEYFIDLRYQKGFGFIKCISLNYISLNVGFQL